MLTAAAAAATGTIKADSVEVHALTTGFTPCPPDRFCLTDTSQKSSLLSVPVGLLPPSAVANARIRCPNKMVLLLLPAAAVATFSSHITDALIEVVLGSSDE